ncbi:MAG: hypothetical protein DI535_00755 [Citrobacter freundii]|nr:MAG: hypothetical protein DI535_00755 [Citrobacter freundii]
MGLKIHGVVNGKTPLSEYIWLTTDQAINLKGYAIVDRTFAADGKISNEFRHIFVFPQLPIEKQDLVRLYTGVGKYSITKRDGQAGVIHNFFWASDTCVWNNNGGDVATLIRYEVINAANVPSVE